MITTFSRSFSPDPRSAYAFEDLLTQGGLHRREAPSSPATTARSTNTPFEQGPRGPRYAYGGQDPAVEAPPAGHPPGQDEQDGHQGHERVGPRRPRKDKARVHEHAEEGGYASEGPKDERDPDQGLPEDHQVGEEGRVGNHHVLQERGVPSRNLRELALSLGDRALCEALHRPTGSLADPAALDPLAQGGVQPLVA